MLFTSTEILAQGDEAEAEAEAGEVKEDEAAEAAEGKDEAVDAADVELEEGSGHRAVLGEHRKIPGTYENLRIRVHISIYT